ncbi:MAG: hypothetical protein JST67_05680 [Bacteroidetes bacterium]|nr:hypothetical protein [Bacteroidota bacterium]
MKKLFYISLSASTLWLTSCGNSENKTNEAESTGADSTQQTVKKDTAPSAVDATVQFKFDFAVANIPSPAQIINSFSQKGSVYNPTLLNSPDNTKKYNTDFEKAIALGVYNLDMSYAIAYNNGGDMMKYFKSSMTEADALGLKSAIDQTMGKRAQDNLSNKDSLFKLIDQLYSQSDSYLRSNERVETASHIFVGSWLETLYIICQTGLTQTDATQKKDTYQELWNQRLYLKNLMDLIAEFKSADSKKLNASLEPIYKQIAAIKDAKDIDEKIFAGISEKIAALRKQLTKN